MSNTIYDQYLYHSQNDEVFIGSDSPVRRCRFCGRELAKEHYSHKAHAISYALGNNIFFCLNECDDCNHKFGTRIEQDIITFFQIPLFLYEFPKRNGCRKLKGRHIEVSRGSSILPEGYANAIAMHLDNLKDGKNLDANTALDCLMKTNFSNKTCVYQNVYKSLCKYVISLLHSEVLKNFEHTTDWILSSEYKENLPKVIMAPNGKDDLQPKMTIFIKKVNNEHYPFCVARLELKHISLLYMVPTFSEDDRLSAWEGISSKADRQYLFDLSAVDRIPGPFRLEMTLETDHAHIYRKNAEGEWAFVRESKITK